MWVGIVLIYVTHHLVLNDGNGPCMGETSAVYRHAADRTCRPINDPIVIYSGTSRTCLVCSDTAQDVRPVDRRSRRLLLCWSASHQTMNELPPWWCSLLSGGNWIQDPTPEHNVLCHSPNIPNSVLSWGAGAGAGCSGAGCSGARSVLWAHNISFR